VAKTFFSFYVFVCDVARKNICDRHRPFYNQQNILLIIKSEKLFIAYKDSIKLEIGSDFSTTFTSLLALFFVFNIPYALENECRICDTCSHVEPPLFPLPLISFL